MTGVDGGGRRFWLERVLPRAGLPERRVAVSERHRPTGLKLTGLKYPLRTSEVPILGW